MSLSTMPYGFFSDNTMPAGAFSTGSSFVLPAQPEIYSNGFPLAGGAFNPYFTGMPMNPMSLIPTGIGPTWNPLYAAVPTATLPQSNLSGMPQGSIYGGLFDGLSGLDPSAFQSVNPQFVQQQKQQEPDFATSLLKVALVATALRNRVSAAQDPGVIDPLVGPVGNNPAQPRRITGPAQTTFQDGAWTFSGELLTKVAQDPAHAKQLIEEEVKKTLTNGDDKKDLTFILKELTGQDIQTADAHHRKKIEGYGLYDEIMNKLTQNVLADLNLDNTQVTGPDKDQIDSLGGVVLSRDTIQAIQNDPANAQKTLDAALLKINGVTTKQELMAKIINNPKYDTKYFTDQTAWCNEMYNTLTKGILDRYKKA